MGRELERHQGIHRAGKTTSTHNCVESSPLVAEKGVGQGTEGRDREAEGGLLVVDGDGEVTCEVTMSSSC